MCKHSQTDVRKTKKFRTNLMVNDNIISFSHMLNDILKYLLLIINDSDVYKH